MKIFKSLALVAGLAFITANVSAQEKAQMDPQKWAEKQTAQIKSSVTGLTTDQESKILTVEQNFAKTMQSVKAGSNGDREAMRSKMQPAKQNRDAQIKGILTPDQYTQYEGMASSRPARDGNK